MASLSNRKLLLIVTGGIAAYKTPELVRRLRDLGTEVRVVMTQGAKAFITPLTLQAVSGHPVHDDLLDPAAEAAMGHIELARWADLIVVAPASASSLARLAHGFADDLFSTLCLATDAPIALVPAMNRLMWSAPATQRNIELLRGDGKLIWGPAEGSQACGEVGAGRMLEPNQILERVQAFFNNTTSIHENGHSIQATGVLHGRSVVITAGPTREAIDPVRYLSNYSSGKMGFALAAAAVKAGASVTLVAGPCQLATPAHVTRVDVVSALDMQQAVSEHIAHCDIFIGCAAVADFRPVQVAQQKMKKQQDHDHMAIELVKNPDILAWVATQSPTPFTVGFAAETNEVAKYARDKLERKGIQLIVANDVSDATIGFNSDNNAVTVYWPEGEKAFATSTKESLAENLVTLIAEHYKNFKKQ
ncbi:bifunctional phosphopantothenoylcysteine decarboxylase/phosphopantothenate--cysteine ligase CoaBC [Aliidiomarina haloalkalitolerans]|uniref:Coenzyme A biosynthesis bifunctional protein CoaBC n=1 Tax=Aliidiomarina haloalkalitolerans TaxID=859059 RepID=A0A432VVK8_9GAMM|nr:bifunctional phosphopantothenoylcysteine decarboxylase/phosphopantothenate--cysteine ligase CoaBC [Aliidiomarina haloalkalitolerans]RUO20612.1 bifunctional phosphopantothenoylcysteine decarboxylase/phosphopantothenate--cysteine ligase CoaBC [Aliidiomarina haloalkalitolerans]